MDQSTKHGPKIDDELKHELQQTLRGERESRAEEWRMVEPSGEDQPDVDRMPNGSMVGGTPEGMTPDDVETRSEIAIHLGIHAFPGHREKLRNIAEENNAPTRITELLEQLPGGKEYENLREVCEDLGIGQETLPGR